MGFPAAEGKKEAVHRGTSTSISMVFSSLCLCSCVGGGTISFCIIIVLANFHLLRSCTYLLLDSHEARQLRCTSYTYDSDR